MKTRGLAMAALALMLALAPGQAGAQDVSQRGFIEGQGYWFPEETATDTDRFVGDLLVREEVVLRPAGWLRLVAGVELRANSHDQVEDEWRLDLEDRGRLRPRAAVRALAANLTAGRFRLEAGKQFVRWGRADIIYPTDRFAPRDYMNVVDTELLPIIAARASLQVGSETFEAVWSPQLTPSRLPLLDQRWSPIPPALPVTEVESDIPNGAQYGARWRHTGSRIEAALSYFDGFNHQPDIDVRTRPEILGVELRRVYPEIRMIGADMGLPMPWLTVKIEGAYIESTSETSDDYVLYVVEIERQLGSWVLDVGYAGEEILERRVAFTFSPDRGLARSIIGRASWAEDPRRTLIVEGAVRQGGGGYYGKVEYSQALGQHWRWTVAIAGLGGDPDDFLGQYRRNSHVAAGLRYSF